MHPGQLAFLLIAGVVAGILSTVVSLASLVSYPALLAVGLPPVSANVTNTVSLVFTGLSGSANSRHELTGQGRRFVLLSLLTAIGGALGALLLLVLPAASFQAAAPVLIAMGSIVIWLQPRLTLRMAVRAPRAFQASRPSRRWLLGVFGASVYIGYFGAGGGVLQLASLIGLLREELIRANALKNALGTVANGVAATGFMLFGPVHWAACVPLAAGFLVGGWLGPPIARRLPTPVLRRSIVAAGLGVAALLAVRTYR